MSIFGVGFFIKFLLNDVHCSLQIYTPYVPNVYKRTKCIGTNRMGRKNSFVFILSYSNQYDKHLYYIYIIQNIN